MTVKQYFDVHTVMSMFHPDVNIWKKMLKHTIVSSFLYNLDAPPVMSKYIQFHSDILMLKEYSNALPVMSSTGDNLWLGGKC